MVPCLLFQFDFDEGHRFVPAVDYIVFHAFRAPVSGASWNRNGSACATRLLQQHLAVGDRRDDVVEAMTMPAGLSARFEVKPGHADTIIVDQGFACSRAHQLSVSMSGGHRLACPLVDRVQNSPQFAEQFVDLGFEMISGGDRAMMSPVVRIRIPSS
jgi:hypothetical protein